MTAVDIGSVVIFDGRRTAGAWGAFLRSLVPAVAEPRRNPVRLAGRARRDR